MVHKPPVSVLSGVAIACIAFPRPSLAGARAQIQLGRHSHVTRSLSPGSRTFSQWRRATPESRTKPYPQESGRVDPVQSGRAM